VFSKGIGKFRIHSSGWEATIMTENHTIRLAEIPIGGNGGFVWNRLHDEREDICGALVHTSESPSQTQPSQDLLQARLRRIDDALDRLMSGSYGNCSKCGHAIDDATLDDDPARARCSDCSGPKLNAIHDGDARPKVMLKDLNSFDTILLRTHNSEYRLLLLDPNTGRALVEGGSYLIEPSEALVRGSAVPGAAFNGGAISVGARLEMWVDENVFLTSPIKSFEVKHNAAAESVAGISAAMH
jgi:hypothetical protein